MGSILGALRSRLSRWRRKVTSAPKPSPIEIYLQGNRLPWSTGYMEFKREVIGRAIADEAFLAVFRENGPLPDNYGSRLDERVVEYPWVWARLRQAPTRLMDAGGTLVHYKLLDQPLLEQKQIVIYTLEDSGRRRWRPNHMRVYGDLRQTALASGAVEEVVCISTLEHIGLDNTQLYTSDERFRENNLSDYLVAIREFRRVLAPGGRLLVTVPYGRYRHHGWLQQFNRTLVEKMVYAFEGEVESEAYYKYEPAGWRSAQESECREAEYFDIHARREFDADYAAAARAVACLALRKPDR